MPNTRYLRIRFSNNLFPREVPYFRAAVIEETERCSSLFHNHQGKDNFIYRYPLIQYKVLQRKAGIICINEGTDDIHYLLQNRHIHLTIGRREPEDFLIEDIQLNYFPVALDATDYQYSLQNWQALNQSNFETFQRLPTEMEQLKFLERILQGHLLAFAGGISWQVESEIQVRIHHIKQMNWLPFKGKKVQVFSLNFSSNMALPDFIGLGKGSSVGFGTIQQFVGRADSTVGSRREIRHHRK